MRSSHAPSRAWLAAGALLGLLTVAGAALSAHLPDRLLAPGGRDSLRAAVQVIGWHAAALLAAALWMRDAAWRRLVHVACLCLLTGTACFSIGVCVPALGGRHLGRLAPTGGILQMAGWLLLAISTLGRPRRRDG
ncbi:DUF423 domain-containing protein [Lichenicoccus sp.]|uniref:DUF423 domain-containing protein n=1 Tax=Lichenicoccus sp. TaxID=2781899 RepID=UPI003D0D537D